MNVEELKRLKAALEANEELADRGFEFTIVGGVLVEREGHARGIWRCNARGFHWTPAGYNEPIHWVADVAEATQYTLSMFSAT